jgi:Na+/H+-translocating membrane pyrophosphatase
VPAPVPGPSKAATAKRGARAFGQAVLGPFTHAGSILWLEITGLFFALFALFFVQSVYRVRTAWRQGPEHAHLLLYCVLALGFGWFSVSSFTRAYGKNKRGPQSRETTARK